MKSHSKNLNKKLITNLERKQDSSSNMEMSIDNNQTSKELLLEAQAHVWQQTFSFINSASLKCAVELGIPDVIHKHGKHMTVPELVANLSIEPARSRSIHTLMRILAHSGFFEESEQGFSLTPSSRLLLKDESLNARAFLQVVLHPVVMLPFHSLSDWFKNGDQNASAFDTTHGRTFWEYTAEEPRIGNLFNEAMAGDSRLITDVLVKHCKGVFEGLSSLVDVGGGTGTVSEAIAKTFPELKCTVFDLPHVVANLQGRKNLDFLGGDMFEGIPPADAILLKWILHDWSDEECVKILKKCKEALQKDKDEAKLIIIDIIINVDDHHEARMLFDMLMMVLVKGKERNEKEWAKLFKDAGFSGYKISPVLGLRSIIEVYP